MGGVDIQADAVLALVLARGGSKGLPGKNLKPLGGVPLIGWAIGAGRASSAVDRLLCSSDDAAILDTARIWGAETPFVRPAAYATDGATDLDVFGHALGWLAEHDGAVPEFVVQLRPTTPFRDPAWIDRAVAIMRADRSISCVRSVAPSPLTPYKMWRMQASGRLEPLLELAGVAEPFNMPRQALPPVHWHTGQLDVIRAETILAGSMTGSHIQALEVDVDSAVDIDHEIDFLIAERVFEARMPDALKQWAARHGK